MLCEVIALSLGTFGMIVIRDGESSVVLNVCLYREDDLMRQMF